MDDGSSFGGEGDTDWNAITEDTITNTWNSIGLKGFNGAENHNPMGNIGWMWLDFLEITVKLICLHTNKIKNNILDFCKVNQMYEIYIWLTLLGIWSIMIYFIIIYTKIYIYLL